MVEKLKKKFIALIHILWVRQLVREQVLSIALNQIVTHRRTPVRIRVVGPTLEDLFAPTPRNLSRGSIRLDWKPASGAHVVIQTKEVELEPIHGTLRKLR